MSKIEVLAAALIRILLLSYPKRVVKDFLIKFTKKPQKSARSTFMLLTLRRVGLLFPGKDFFANGLVFRQPFKEGLPAPLYLGQFQRVGVCSVWSLPVICNTSIDTSENSIRASCSAV